MLKAWQVCCTACPDFTSGEASVVLAAYVVNGALAPGIAPCGSGGDWGDFPKFGFQVQFVVLEFVLICFHLRFDSFLGSYLLFFCQFRTVWA